MQAFFFLVSAKQVSITLNNSEKQSTETVLSWYPLAFLRALEEADVTVS